MITNNSNWYLEPRGAAIAIQRRAELIQHKDMLQGLIDSEPVLQTVDNVAVIPVNGAMGQGLNEFEKVFYGMTDYKDIRADMEIALSMAQIDTVVLHMNTPGGSVVGVSELAEYIQDYPKQVFAFTDSLMASAGYYLASSCNHIVSTYSANIGSIGTIMSFADVSGLFEKLGIKIEVISSGKFKGMGTAGTSLTDEQRQFLKDSVNESAEEFKAHVQANRGAMEPEAMEGQTFSGNDALERNLIDATVNGIDELLEYL